MSLVIEELLSDQWNFMLLIQSIYDHYVMFGEVYHRILMLLCNVAFHLLASHFMQISACISP